MSEVVVTDKTQIMLTYIKTCPTLTNSSLFFNFGDVRDNAYQVCTTSDDISLQKPYIDGSILKRYTLNLDCFKSIDITPIYTEATDANLSDFKEAQAIIDWITAQNKSRTYPNFGNKIVIDEMKSLTNKPQLLMVDTSVSPNKAVYRISIQIDYLDNTDKLF